MIEKILDRYYTKKLINELHWIFSVRGIDYKYKIKENKVYYYIKPRQYKDKFYNEIINIDMKESLKYLIDYENFSKQVKNIVEEAFKKLSGV